MSRRPGTATSSASRPGTAKSTASGAGGGGAGAAGTAGGGGGGSGNGGGNNRAAGSPPPSAAAVAAQGAASPPGSAAAALLDQMERLLGDADAKFVERSKTLIEAASSSAAGVALHVDRGGASLRQQVAHNHHLMADRRFKEMLDDCERCLAPEFSLRGDVLDRAMQAMLASLLKALLKEAAALSSPAARKVQIEMTYQWWQDKRREILDVVLSRMPKLRTKAEAVAAAAAAEQARRDAEMVAAGRRAGDDIDSVVSPRQKAVLAALNGGDPREGECPPLAVAPCPPLSLRADIAAEKDRSEVAQKLRLYMKHDLAAAHAVRTGQQLGVVGVGFGVPPQPNNNLSPLRGTTTQSRVVLNSTVRSNQQQQQQLQGSAGKSKTMMRGTGGSQQQQQQQQQQPQQYHGAAREDAPAGPLPFQHLSAQVAPRGHVDQNSVPNTVEDAMATAHQRLVRHAARKLEERFSEREAIDVNAALSHNRSRLMEETARKLESREYSSQSGRTTQVILTKVRQSDGTLVDARSRLPSARFDRELAEREQAADSGGSALLSGRGGNPRSPLSPSASSLGGAVTSPTGDASAAVLSALKKVSYQGQDVSFSPYDHYQLRPQDEQRLKALMERVDHPNDGSGELPPVSPKFAIFDDRVNVAHAKRHDLRVLQPQGVAGSAYANQNNASTGPGRPTSAPPVKRLASSAAASGGGSSFSSPTASRAPVSPVASPAASVLAPPLPAALQQKATLHHLMRDLFPEVFDGHDELAPSMRKLEQMRVVDKVRDAFARRNPEAMPSYDKLVRALVTPDDLPHELCARHLPRPGSSYPRKFTAA